MIKQQPDVAYQLPGRIRVACRRALNIEQQLSFNIDQGLTAPVQGGIVDNYSRLAA